MLTAIMKATGLSKLTLGIAAIVLIIAAVGLIYALSARSQDKRVNEAFDSGVTTERGETNADTIKQVEKGNAAESEVRQAGPVGDRARYDQCVQSNRAGPANCQRFLPAGQAH